MKLVPDLRERLAKLSPEDRKVAEDAIREIEAVQQINPLALFEPHKAQQPFFGAKTPIVAAFAGNRFGKCQIEGTQVRMADGTVKAIEDIRVGEWVVGVNMDGTTRPSMVTGTYDQGVKDVWRFDYAKRGHEASFTATLEHKMLARPECSGNRIVPAGDVKKRWVAQRQLGFDPGPSGDPDEEHALLTGLLLGDGCLTGGPVMFTCADDEIRVLAEAETERAGCRLRRNEANKIQYAMARPKGSFVAKTHRANPIRALAQRQGFDCYAHEKRIPDAAWRWSNEAVGRLLAGLILTDGTVAEATHVQGDNGGIQFHSVSRELVEGVKALMEQRFGIYGTRVLGYDRPEKKRTEYVWGVGNYAGLTRLAQSVPLVGRKRDRLEKLLTEWRGKVSDGAGLIYRGREYVGKRQTYDITIDHPTHLFALANGLVVSNTTALTVRLLIECVEESWLPRWLVPYKRWTERTAPHGTACRIVNPSFALLESVILPAFRLWTPPGALRGGSFDKAFKGAPDRRLTFVNGSSISFMTHEQDLDKFGGSALHVVGYDEPPPQDIREECNYRLADYNGYELFACTPLKVNVGWMRRDIWRQRERPDITVVRGSIHDNPNISPEGKKKALEGGDPRLRAAREFGDFVDVGGLVYPDFERCVIEPPRPEEVRGWDHVVGIDPGVRNAGFGFFGFDDDLAVTMYDEGLLQDATVTEYVEFIQARLRHWGIPFDDVMFVIDPAARSRGHVNAETVLTALAREGIFCVPGQNDLDAGVTEILTRMQHNRFRVSSTCRYTRDAADEYAAEDRGDGKFVPVKTGREHTLDVARYVCLQRPFNPLIEDDLPGQRLGWQPNTALPGTAFRVPKTSAPMGSMS